MIKEIERLSEEIDNIIDSYIPYKMLLSIPVDKHLFHYLKIEGVYLLYSGKTIIYIGCSINIGSRLSAHLANPDFGKQITDVKIIRFLPHESPMEVEARLIKKFKPTYNKINQYLNCSSLPSGFDLEEIIKEMDSNPK